MEEFMVTNFTFLTQHGSTCSSSHSIPRHGAVVATMGAGASGDAGRGEAWLGGGVAVQASLGAGAASSSWRPRGSWSFNGKLLDF
jgi:hypothetical protein